MMKRWFNRMRPQRPRCTLLLERTRLTAVDARGDIFSAPIENVQPEDYPRAALQALQTLKASLKGAAISLIPLPIEGNVFVQFVAQQPPGMTAQQRIALHLTHAAPAAEGTFFWQGLSLGEEQLWAIMSDRCFLELLLDEIHSLGAWPSALSSAIKSQPSAALENTLYLVLFEGGALATFSYKGHLYFRSCVLPEKEKKEYSSELRESLLLTLHHYQGRTARPVPAFIRVCGGSAAIHALIGQTLCAPAQEWGSPSQSAALLLWPLFAQDHPSLLCDPDLTARLKKPRSAPLIRRIVWACAALGLCAGSFLVARIFGLKSEIDREYSHTEQLKQVQSVLDKAMARLELLKAEYTAAIEKAQRQAQLYNLLGHIDRTLPYPSRLESFSYTGQEAHLSALHTPSMGLFEEEMDTQLLIARALLSEHDAVTYVSPLTTQVKDTEPESILLQTSLTLK